MINKTTISTAAGTDPGEVDVEDRSIPSQVYGDDFPEIVETCPQNPVKGGGPHIYSKDYFRFARCVHCHQPSGLDQ